MAQATRESLTPAPPSTFSPLGSRRTLPPKSCIYDQSCCPSMDLIVFSSAAPSTSSQGSSTQVQGDRVHLWRTSGTTTSGKVWEVEVDKLVTGASLPRANANLGWRVSDISWIPDGSYLAVSLYNANPSTSTERSVPPCIILLDVHTGSLVVPPVFVPNSQEKSSMSQGRFRHLRWAPLDPIVPRTKSSLRKGKERERETIAAEGLVQKLPALPRKDQAKPESSSSKLAMAAIVPAGLGLKPDPSSDKASASSFTLPRVCPFFPSFPPFNRARPGEEDYEPIDADDQTAKAREETVLLAVDDTQSVHVFLGGSLWLGSVDLLANEDPSIPEILGMAFLGSPSIQDSTADLPAERDQSSLFALIASIKSGRERSPLLDGLGLASSTSLSEGQRVLAHLTLSIPLLPVPPLFLIARAATAIRSLLNHSFEALEDARKSWEEASSTGVKWFSRTSSAESDAAKEAITIQLLKLLTTGRPSDNLHDFFSSKMTERTLVKWHSSMSTAFVKVRNTCFANVVPCMERIIVWLEELRGWMAWEDRFRPFHELLSLDQLNTCVELAKGAAFGACKLERQVNADEIGFAELMKWLRYEIEVVGQTESADSPPPRISHDPLVVAKYIEGPLWTSPIHSLLRWTGPDFARSATAASLIRLKPPTVGADRLRKALANLTSAVNGDPGVEKLPTAIDPSNGRDSQTTSVLDVVAKVAQTAEGLLSPAFRLAPSSRLVSSEALAILDARSEETPTVKDIVVKQETTTRHYVATYDHKQTASQGVVTVWDVDVFSPSHPAKNGVAVACLSIPGIDADSAKITDLAFFDDKELALAIQAQTSQTQSSLTMIAYPGVPFATAQEQPTQALEVTASRQHILDQQFPPNRMALNGAKGRRFGCVLEADGRGLEVFDMDVNDEGEVTEGQDEDDQMNIDS